MIVNYKPITTKYDVSVSILPPSAGAVYGGGSYWKGEIATVYTIPGMEQVEDIEFNFSDDSSLQFSDSRQLFVLEKVPNINEDSDFEFDGWYNGEEKVSSDLSYSFPVEKNINLVAKYSSMYTVSILFDTDIGGIYTGGG